MRDATGKQRIVIVGAGPAGSSLAIRLASAGHTVTLIERERFPRHKLCGEFISPESFAHFRDLGVAREMFAAGGERIVRTDFFAPSGRSVSVPTEWFGAGGGALSLSRAAMDKILIDRARAAGSTVFEETSVAGIETERGKVRGVIARSKDGSKREVDGDIFVDATGRSRVLARLAETAAKPKAKGPASIIGFKAHFRGADIESGVCEIYFFDGGYGGLSRIEGGIANHCFLVRADLYKAAGSVERLVETVVFQNSRARSALASATNAGEWLAVSVESFGRGVLRPMPNLIAVGDSAAFIDPFTGSGMLLAFESAAVLADALRAGEGEISAPGYEAAYSARFSRRLTLCRMLRKAAFSPSTAAFLIGALRFGRPILRHLARETRSASAKPEIS